MQTDQIYTIIYGTQKINVYIPITPKIISYHSQRVLKFNKNVDFDTEGNFIVENFDGNNYESDPFLLKEMSKNNILDGNTILDTDSPVYFQNTYSELEFENGIQFDFDLTQDFDSIVSNNFDLINDNKSIQFLNSDDNITMNSLNLPNYDNYNTYVLESSKISKGINNFTISFDYYEGKFSKDYNFTIYNIKYYYDIITSTSNNKYITYNVTYDDDDDVQKDILELVRELTDDSQVLGFYRYLE